MACGIGIISRVMSTSRDAIVRLDHGRLGAASFGFSFGCEGGALMQVPMRLVGSRGGVSGGGVQLTWRWRGGGRE
jgi:hypothetical protein